MKPSTFFIMERRGNFALSESTDNQCKVKGHPFYDYTCKLVFDQTQELDENDFLIDHAEIDSIIMNKQLKGSCERVEKVIMDELHREIHKRDMKVVAIKVTVIPYPVGVAHMTCVWTKNVAYLPLLNG